MSEPAEPLITTAIAVPGKEEAIDAALASDPPAVVPESSAAPEIVAAEARQADEPPLTAVAAASVEADDSPRLVLHSAPSEPDSAPAGAAPPPAKPAKPGKGFLLQLGVFGDTGNAQALYEELRRQGLAARLETRVVAGPFNSRKSAEAARERLARAGLARGLVVSER